MTAPAWIASVVRDFGRGAGLGDLALNERGAAAFRFENGVTLRLEYAGGELVVAVAAPAADDPATARRLLAFAHPGARLGATVRAGRLARSGSAVFAVRIAAQDVTLPAVDSAFGALWRVASEFGGET